MNRCGRCQADNRPARRFCAECGAPLTQACPACGFANEPGEKFCGGCGQPLEAPPAASTKFASPQAYTPKHLAKKILHDLLGQAKGGQGQVVVRLPPWAPHHLGLGELYRRTGNSYEAREHLTTATAMLRAMGMRFWLEQAEAERKGLR